MDTCEDQTNDCECNICILAKMIANKLEQEEASKQLDVWLNKFT